LLVAMSLILVLEGVINSPFPAIQSSTKDDLIDLTHPVNENTIAWPSVKQFSVDKVFKGELDLGAKKIWYESRDISSSEHAGTHLDAPTHIRNSEGGWSTSDIPLDRLMGPGIKIDISKQSGENVDYMLRAEDLLAWEAGHGPIPQNCIVLVHTGRGHLYATDKQKYLGRPDGLDLPETDTEHLHFPGLGEEAAKLLVQRGVMGVGIDTPSLDPGQSRDYPAHRTLLGENIWGLENVARTEVLPPKGFFVYNLMPRLEGGSGAPTRVIAVIQNN